MHFVTTLFFRDPEITILKLVVYKNCVRTIYHYGDLGAKLPAAGQFLQYFRKNSHFNAIWMTFWTLLEHLKKLNYLNLEEYWKNMFCSVQSAPAHLQVKSKICLKAERLRIWIKSFK